MEASDLVRVVEPEPHEYQERWVTLAARVLVGSGIFFFICFAYAFFYLRSIDSAGQWKPHHASPSQGLGAAIAFVGVFAALAVYGAQRAGARAERTRLDLVGAGLALVIVTIALQVIEYVGLGFGPSSGGYASVFVGWTSMQALAWLGTAIWLEIIFAGAWRARVDDPSGDVRMTAVNVSAATTWCVFLAVAGLVAWIVLYLV